MAYPPTVYQPPPAEASARGPRGFTARWRACGSRCYNCGKSGGEAFFRVKIDAQFSEAGWDMLDGRSVKIFGKGEDERDYVFVEDAVGCIEMAAAGDGPGPYNVGSGIGTSTNRVFEQLATICNYQLLAEKAPPRAGDLHRITLDSSKAGRDLGWSATTSVDDGLRKTVDWFRGQAR